MRILGIQKHHNSSACLFIDGELIYYNQEERLSRKKGDYGIPVRCLEEIKKICDIVDKVIITGYDDNLSEDQLVKSFTEKLGIKCETWFSFHTPHHLSHATKAFYSSGFDEALVVVCDGCGSIFNLDDGTISNETTSAYTVRFSEKMNVKYKRLYTASERKMFFEDSNMAVKLENSHDIGGFYESVSLHLGFGQEECGKMMGLQSYGKYNKNLPNLIVDGEFNSELFKDNYSKQIDIEKFNILNNDESNINNLIDFAYHTQKAFEQIYLGRIEKLLQQTKCRNLILTGGTALNVVANNFIRKNIPKHINMFIDPLCGDEGNSIGTALHFLYDECGFKRKVNFDRVYLGPKPNYVFTLQDGEVCFDNIAKEEICKLLGKTNIISILQSSSEAGPRALGNRSILFDPRVKNGKDIVNGVKKREWFRPFACSILLEHSRDWFDMLCLDESPYMMYALDALPGVKEKIPAVVHVDNTCRVQTLTKQQNKHFYELIEEFYKMTGVPLLLNTSFNLAGDPLVETIEDALDTLRKSELEYLYLPELDKLIYIKNENKQLT